MTLEAFKQAGIQFSFCRHAVVPEIPYVQDVMFALRLSEKQEYYEFCLWNHSTYITNIGLVIAAVSGKVLNQKKYDEGETRKIIARAIIELCPNMAKCLSRRAYAEAMEIVGETLQAKTIGCPCPDCRA